jgi:hypothetical protein
MSSLGRNEVHESSIDSLQEEVEVGRKHAETRKARVRVRVVVVYMYIHMGLQIVSVPEDAGLSICSAS